MPDMKYSDKKIGRRYSRIENYPDVNQAAVKEMHRQVGGAWGGVKWNLNPLLAISQVFIMSLNSKCVTGQQSFRSWNQCHCNLRLPKVVQDCIQEFKSSEISSGYGIAQSLVSLEFG